MSGTNRHRSQSAWTAYTEKCTYLSLYLWGSVTGNHVSMGLFSIVKNYATGDEMCCVIQGSY
jgi:hypothetical protein